MKWPEYRNPRGNFSSLNSSLSSLNANPDGIQGSRDWEFDNPEYRD